MTVFGALAGLWLLAAHARTQTLDAPPQHSGNVSACPGYALTGLQETAHGLTAQLNLAGPACNAFGTDFKNLTIQVTYDTQTR
jgi:alpha-glucosidase